MATTVTITNLPSITSLEDDDILIVNDTSASTTKKITRGDLFGQLETDVEELLANGVRSVTPNLDSAYDLGTSAKKWRNVFVGGEIQAGSFVGDGSGLTNVGTGASSIIEVVPSSLNTNHSILFTQTASGQDSVNTDASLLYNPSTNVLTAGSYLGDASNMTGRVDSSGIISLLSTGVNSILPAADSAYDLGSASKKWKDLYLSGNTIYIGGQTLSVDGSGNLKFNDSDVSVGSISSAIDGASVTDFFSENVYVRSSASTDSSGIFSNVLYSGSVDILHNGNVRMSFLNGGSALYVDTTTYNQTQNVYTDLITIASSAPKMTFTSENVRQSSSEDAIDFGWWHVEGNLGAGTFESVGIISYNQATVTYGGTSDYRLKENIVPLDSALDRLAQIPVHRFNFKRIPDQTYDGFLSHEVQAVVPEAVIGEKDAVDSDGKIIPQMLDQGKLIPLLVASVKELKDRVEQLEAQLSGL